jgi:hypothetical protein
MRSFVWAILTAVRLNMRGWCVEAEVKGRGGGKHVLACERGRGRLMNRSTQVTSAFDWVPLPNIYILCTCCMQPLCKKRGRPTRRKKERSSAEREVIARKRSHRNPPRNKHTNYRNRTLFVTIIQSSLPPSIPIAAYVEVSDLTSGRPRLDKTAQWQLALQSFKLELFV